MRGERAAKATQEMSGPRGEGLARLRKELAAASYDSVGKGGGGQGGPHVQGRGKAGYAAGRDT
jgi:hypothetical protein